MSVQTSAVPVVGLVRESEDAERINQFPLVQHRNIVEVEKVQRADGFQLAHVSPFRSTVPGQKCSKVSLSKKW